MKIAFCLYGQPRLFRKGFENIKEFCILNSDHEFVFFSIHGMMKNLLVNIMNVLNLETSTQVNY
jgi:hypothetical protein